MGEMILFSAVAGIIGTGLGGIVSALLLKKPSDGIICWMLSFAAGVMVSIVCFSLVPETIELTNVAVCLFGLTLGIVIIMTLNRMVDKISLANEAAAKKAAIAKDKLKIHYTHEELYHESNMINDSINDKTKSDKAKMLRSGILILFAIGLHNIPEGIAISAGGSHDIRLGSLLALMIALHNIPEGMAIAAPLLAGGVNRWKVALLTALSGAPTFLGGLIGVLIGHISDFGIAMSLSAAGGAMLYVVFGEIVPQSVVMTKNRTASIVTMFGVIVGLIVTQL